MADTLATPTIPQANVSAAQSQLASAKNRKAVHEAAVKFEAMFMNEMMSYMGQDLKSDGPFGGGHGEEMFRSLMTEQYGRQVAQSGQTGVGAALEKQMLLLQELRARPDQPVNTQALKLYKGNEDVRFAQ